MGRCERGFSRRMFFPLTVWGCFPPHCLGMYTFALCLRFMMLVSHLDILQRKTMYSFPKVCTVIKVCTVQIHTHRMCVGCGVHGNSFQLPGVSVYIITWYTPCVTVNSIIGFVYCTCIVPDVMPTLPGLHSCLHVTFPPHLPRVSVHVCVEEIYQVINVHINSTN